MKNFRQKGDTCTFFAPYAVASGGGFLVGSIFAVANGDAAQGAEVEGDVASGVYTLPKSTAASSGATAGTKAYWDDAGKRVTKTASGNTLIGAYLRDCADGDTSCVIRTNGTVS